MCTILMKEPEVKRETVLCPFNNIPDLLCFECPLSSHHRNLGHLKGRRFLTDNQLSLKWWPTEWMKRVNWILRRASLVTLLFFLSFLFLFPSLFSLLSFPSWRFAASSSLKEIHARDKLNHLSFYHYLAVLFFAAFFCKTRQRKMTAANVVIVVEKWMCLSLNRTNVADDERKRYVAWGVHLEDR